MLYIKQKASRQNVKATQGTVKRHLNTTKKHLSNASGFYFSSQYATNCLRRSGPWGDCCQVCFVMFCLTAEYSSLEIMPNQLCERVSDEHSVQTHERSLQGKRLKEMETFTNDVMNWICNHICAATTDIPVCLTVCDPLS